MVATIETTGTLLFKSSNATESSVNCKSASLTFSTVSVIAVCGSLVALTSLLFIAGVQPDKPSVAASAISKPLNPLAFTPSFLLPVKVTSSHLLSFAK